MSHSYLVSHSGYEGLSVMILKWWLSLFLLHDLNWKCSLGSAQVAGGTWAIISGMVCSQALDLMDCYHNILTYKQLHRWSPHSQWGFTAHSLCARWEAMCQLQFTERLAWRMMSVWSGREMEGKGKSWEREWEKNKESVLWLLASLCAKHIAKSHQWE